MALTNPDEVRALALRLRSRVGELADGMYDSLAARIPVAQSDPELAALTRASCTSNVETILSMLISDIPASAAEAPVTALQHARLMAQRGAEVDDTLRFYRLGLGYFARLWTTGLRATGMAADELLDTLEGTTAFMVEYIDIVSSRVSAEHLAERERRQRRAVVIRADVVRALMDAEPLDVAAAERTLQHRLDRPQLAFLCWSTHSGAQLERAAGRIAAATGSDRPLLVMDGPTAIGGWVTPRHGAPVDRAELEHVLESEGGVSVAFGAVGRGVDGFRASRRQAERARRVAELAGSGDARSVHFADVALLDLLSGDVEAARAFVRTELGGLAAPDPAVAELRRTLLAVLEPRGGVAHAARVDGLHRNTVLHRVRRAEELRGSPSDVRATELHAALLLAERLPAALRDD
jgi:hypothetical protein